MHVLSCCRTMTSSRLQRWVAALFSVGVMLPLLWLTATWSEQQSLQYLERKGAEHLRHYTRQLVNMLNGYEVLPGILAEDDRVRDLLRARTGTPLQVRAANDYLERLAGDLPDSVIYLMDPQGWTLAASNWRSPSSFVGKNYGFRSYFRQVLSGHPSRYVAKGITSNVLGYYLGARVMEGERVLGVVMLKLNLAEATLSSDGDVDVLVADHHGVVFMASQADWLFRLLQSLEARIQEQIVRDRQFEGASLQALAVARQAWSDTTALVDLTVTPTSTRRYMVQAALLPENGWQVQTLIRLDRVWQEQWHALLLVGLGGLAVLLVLLYLLQRYGDRRVLREATVTDALTGLYNRHYLVNTDSMLLQRYHRGPVNGTAVVIFGIDAFARVNQIYGHSVGNKVLLAVADALRGELRVGDVPIRLDGDRFMAVLAVHPGDDVRPMAERMRRRVQALRFEGGLRALVLTVSAGIAYYRPPEAMDRLIGRATERLREAQEHGDVVVAPTLDEECVEVSL